MCKRVEIYIGFKYFKSEGFMALQGTEDGFEAWAGPLLFVWSWRS